MRNKLKKTFQNQAGFGMAGIIIAVVVVVAVVAVFFILHPWKKEPIKIGAILSLSGPGGSYGKDVRDGLLLAIKEINAHGGINGRNLELIIEDSKTSPQEAKMAFNRIEATHHPLFYVSALSSVAFALAPLAEKNKVVLLGTLVTSHKLTIQKQWVFKYFSSAETEVPPTLSILQDLKVRELGILYLHDEYGTSVFGLLKKGFEGIGGTAKGEAFDVKGSDIKEKVTKLINFEAIYVVGFSPHIKAALKQLREKKFPGFILGGNASSSPEITSMPEANGLYITAPVVYNPNYLFAKELKEKYEAEYSKPLIQWAANGYDSVKLLVSLLEDKEISRRNMNSLLEGGFIYPGVFGSLDIKPGEHDIVYELLPAQIVNGKIKYRY